MIKNSKGQKITCRRCKSSRITRCGIRKVGGKNLQQYKCNKCGFISYKMYGTGVR